MNNKLKQLLEQIEEEKRKILNCKHEFYEKYAYEKKPIIQGYEPDFK